MDAPTTPAHRIVARFGVPSLARWTGRNRTRVHAWTWSPEKGGTGGMIPRKVRPSIVAGALQDHGVSLSPSEFELQAGEAYLDVLPLQQRSARECEHRPNEHGERP